MAKGRLMNGSGFSRGRVYLKMRTSSWRDMDDHLVLVVLPSGTSSSRHYQDGVVLLQTSEGAYSQHRKGKTTEIGILQTIGLPPAL